MDWSRAKSILIIALIICNLVLGSFYMSGIKEERAEIEQMTENAISYMESKGIDIVCEVPLEIDTIPVITLKLKEGNSAGGLARTEYDGIPLEVVGLRSSDYIESLQKTDSVIEVLPAYTALLKSIESVEGEVDDIELIYLVDRAEYAGEAGQDTALPYWKISSQGNSYYYAAFAE